MVVSNSTAPCFPARQAVSNGVLQGDSPIHFALPLLIIQIILVLAVTRTMALLFKPFRQPRVLAEIIGGVLLGPSCFGRNRAYLDAVFPSESLTLLDTIATFGLLFFLFMVGLELDVDEIRKSGRGAVMVALSGICVPFIAGIGLASLFQESIPIATRLAPLVVFMGVPISITSFGVLVRIMAERKLLTTPLGKMVVPAAAINDFFAWILLGVGVSISGPSTSPATPVYVLLCGLGFVLFMLLVVKKGMEWIAHKANGEETVSEMYVCVALVGVLVAGFMTDVIGIHPLFGALVFGLTVPKEGNFANMLTEKIEDFVTVLMLPMFFASSGLKTNLGSINSFKAFGILILVILTATVGKVSATVGVALLSFKVKLQDAFAFGFLMNTKGLAELIVLNVGKDLGVLNDEIFAILVLMCLLMMFITTPAVVALYKPARVPAPYRNRKLEGMKDEIRVLVCIHGTRGIPGVLNLVEACRGVKKSSLKLFAMHLIELTERPSAIIALGKALSDAAEAASSEDSIFVAFKTFGTLSKVPIRPLSTISKLSDMHDDVCNAAADKRATIIILPCALQYREDGTVEYGSQGFKHVHQRVLQHAPCSVGIFVDKGIWGSDHLSQTTTPQKVAVVFLGGPDDREALAFACRLAGHPNVLVWVLRLLPTKGDANSMVSIGIDLPVEEGQPTIDVPTQVTKHNHSLDEESLFTVKQLAKNAKEHSRQSIYYEERNYENPLDQVRLLAKSSDYSLIVVGRGGHHPVEALPAERHTEHSELGTLGDSLVKDGEIKASVFVVQQYKKPVVSDMGLTDHQPKG